MLAIPASRKRLITDAVEYAIGISSGGNRGGF